MLNKNLEEIKLEDLRQLIADGVPEGKTIEYKRDFYRLANSDEKDRVKQHEEMLKDISSFANTLGGDLIIGIEDTDGKPIKVCGFDTTTVSPNVDKLKLRIHDLVQKWLDPRVAMSIQSVDISPGKVAFVIRVIRSPIGPHRVTYGGKQGPFWDRHSSGTNEMDTDELRRAFTNSASVEERITEWRNKRIRAIIGNQTPVVLSRPQRMIGHLIPLDSFTSQLSFSMQELQGQFEHYRQFQSTSGWSPIINIDGLVACDVGQGPDAAGYVFAFRKGIIESVVDDIYHFSPMDERKTIPAFRTGYPQEIIRCLGCYLKAMRNLKVQPPLWFSLTLTGVKGMYIDMGNGIDRNPNPVDRDRLDLPPVEITDLENVDCETLLMPMFDALWNASGHARCVQYDHNKRFRGVR
jgi:hypothetical protein